MATVNSIGKLSICFEVVYLSILAETVEHRPKLRIELDGFSLISSIKVCVHWVP